MLTRLLAGSIRRAPQTAAAVRLRALARPRFGARSASTIFSDADGNADFAGAASSHSSRDGEGSSDAARSAASKGGGARGRVQKYSVDEVVNWLDAELAVSLTVMDARGLMGGVVGDFLVFATARSASHMKRIAKSVAHELKSRGVVMYGSAPTIEGLDADDGWMLIDGGQVVINVMTAEAQRELRLEPHWEMNGAKVVHERQPPGQAPGQEAEPLLRVAAAAGAAYGSGLSAEDGADVDGFEYSAEEDGSIYEEGVGDFELLAEFEAAGGSTDDFELSLEKDSEEKEHAEAIGGGHVDEDDDSASLEVGDEVGDYEYEEYDEAAADQNDQGDSQAEEPTRSEGERRGQGRGKR